LRIGLHVGDVMVDGNNLLGDSINIAASPTWPLEAALCGSDITVIN
jgi:hypothetical protein